MICYRLIAAGTYRSLYLSSDVKRLWFMLPLAYTLFLGFIHLLVQPINPYNFFYPSTTPAEAQTEQTLAVVGFLFYSIVLSMLTLYTIRRWKLSFGFFTIVYTITAAALIPMQHHPIIAVIGFFSGLFTDIAYLLIKPSMARVEAFRLFAAIAPTIFFTVYFITLLLTTGIVWTVHLSVGTIVAAGLIGWLLTYLVIPSARPEETTTVASE